MISFHHRSPTLIRLDAKDGLLRETNALSNLLWSHDCLIEVHSSTQSGNGISYLNFILSEFIQTTLDYFFHSFTPSFIYCWSKLQCEYHVNSPPPIHSSRVPLLVGTSVLSGSCEVHSWQNSVSISDKRSLTFFQTHLVLWTITVFIDTESMVSSCGY